MLVLKYSIQKQKHGNEQDLDHFTCIINGLGHASRIKEAEVLLNKISFKDGLTHSSCRVHVNVALAKRAANELFR